MIADDSKRTGLIRGRDPLVLALVSSLLLHLAFFGGWQIGKQFGWWQHQPTWLTNLTRSLAKLSPAPVRPTAPQQPPVIAMTFVEVDPATVTAEAPDKAKYYGAKNSKAANPDPKQKEIPKVDGKQNQVVRLMDNEKPKPFPLQPSPPKEPKPEEPVVQPKPKIEKPGDLALVRPKETKPPTDGSLDTDTGDSNNPPKDRPRTLAAARAQKAALAGEKIRQDGGSPVHGSVAFDVKATPFGDYDRDFIAAVQQCWYNLIDEHQGTHRAGKVTVDFRLTHDGRITDIKVQENEVGEILSMLCQSAIQNPAPYPRWPTAMRQVIPGNYREIRFTFYYN